MAKAKTSITTENRSGSAADAAAKEQRTEMPLSDLHPFEGHPFKVLDDELMEQTVESIKQIGVVSWQLMLIARTFITTLFLIRLHWTAPENSAIFTYPVLRWRGSVISSVWNTGCRSLSGSPMESGRRERNIRRKNRSGMKSARPLMQHWKENQKTSGN